MRSTRCVGLAVAIALLVSLGLAAPGSAGFSKVRTLAWGHLQHLDVHQPSNNAVIAGVPSGNPGGAFAVAFSATGPLGRQQIAGKFAARAVRSVNAVRDSSGRTYVIWHHAEGTPTWWGGEFDPELYEAQLHISVVKPDGTTSHEHAFPTAGPGQDSRQPLVYYDIASLPTGGAVVVVSNNSERGIVEAIRLSASGDLEGVSTILTSEEAYDPQVAVDHRGWATVVANTSEGLKAVRVDSTGAPGAVQLLTPGIRGPQRVEIDARGRAVAAWEDERGVMLARLAADRDATLQYTRRAFPPVRLNSGYLDSPFSLALAKGGRAFVTIVRSSPRRSQDRFSSVIARQVSLRGEMTQPRRVRSRATFGRLVMSSTNRPLLAMEVWPKRDRRMRLVVGILRPDGSLARTSRSTFRPYFWTKMAADGSGGALLAGPWPGPGTEESRIRTVRFDPARP